MSISLASVPALGAMAATDLATSINDLAAAMVIAGLLLLVLLAFAAGLTRDKWPQLKMPLFILMAVVALGATITVTGSVIALNSNSPTGGPVRWHANYQVWACGNQLDLRDPDQPYTNRIGSNMLYEQNDGVIHLSGTPVNLDQDASLGAFMQVVGGAIGDNTFTLPINDNNAFAGLPGTPEQVQPYIATNKSGNYVQFSSGQLCGTTKATVQAFVYQYNAITGRYSQVKLDHPANYQFAHATDSSPADCIIIEFGPAKNSTDHVCTGVWQ